MKPIFIKFKYKDCNPINIYSKLGAKENTVILDSGDSSEKIARWSFIGMDPFLIFRSKNNRNEIIYPHTKSTNSSGLSNSKNFGSSLNNDNLTGSEFGVGVDDPLKKPKNTIVQGDPLTILKQLFDQYKIKQKNKLPPFFGGLAGFFSYDLVNYFENIPQTTLDDAKNYDCYFLFIKTVVALDKLNQEVWIITNVEENAKDMKAVCKRGMDVLAKLKNRILKGKEIIFLSEKNINISSLRSNYTFSEYKKMVEQTKKYIKSGDIYQANLSQRFKAKVKNIDSFYLYQKLRKINPSPFACFLDFPDVKIISSSPERLIKISGKIIETRPIAGTRPRGKGKVNDKKMEKELILNEKERAEHIMLVDLERNDLGRVCKYNSVKVDELMVLEKYSHVIHIVSNVKGKLQKGRDAFDCIRACFPGGTITGVPKVRCMEIIDELEKHRRGPYTGSAGYISFNGDMDLNILIRTFVLKDNNLYFQVGGGIVADSVPEKEYEETLHKAEALMEAIGVKFKEGAGEFNAHQHKR